MSRSRSGHQSARPDRSALASRAARATATATCATALAVAGATLRAQSAAPSDTGPSFDDSHFHLTNYIQRGTDLTAFLGMMGSRVGRVALFGIPLQQMWSARIDGDSAPTYYLHT